MVKYFGLILACVAIFASAQAQQVDLSKLSGEPVNISVSLRLSEPYFNEYRKNDTIVRPTGLMQDKSVVEFTLYKIYTEGVSGNHLESLNAIPEVKLTQVSAGDTSQKNYVRLIHKLTFGYKQNLVSIIKYQEVVNGESRQPTSNTFIQSSNGWKLFTSADIGYIERVVGYMKTSSFWEFYNKSNGNTDFINRVKKSLKTEDGILNISLLSAYLDRLKKENPQQYFQICDR